MTSSPSSDTDSNNDMTQTQNDDDETKSESIARGGFGTDESGVQVDSPYKKRSEHYVYSTAEHHKCDAGVRDRSAGNDLNDNEDAPTPAPHEEFCAKLQEAGREKNTSLDDDAGTAPMERQGDESVVNDSNDNDDAPVSRKEFCELQENFRKLKEKLNNLESEMESLLPEENECNSQSSDTPNEIGPRNETNLILNLNLDEDEENECNSQSSDTPNEIGPRNETNLIRNLNLDEDTFSLMIIGQNSKEWILGLAAFATEIVLGIMIVLNQINDGVDSSIFNIPFKVPWEVHVGQFLSIIICLSTQSDVLTAIHTIIMLCQNRKKPSEGAETVQSRDEDVEDPRCSRTKCCDSLFTRALVSNVLKFIQGVVVYFVSCVIIVQSDNIIELLKDFTALLIICEFDNFLFKLAGLGFLGQELGKLAAEVKNHNEVKSNADDDANDETNQEGWTYRVRSSGLFVLFSIIFALWILVVRFQSTGYFFDKQYPNCTEDFDLVKREFGKGDCYGGPLNTLECEFEGGDCIDFNLAYPLCKGKDLTDVQEKVGNGKCDPEFNKVECDYDGGDCEFPMKYPNCAEVDLGIEQFGDGKCYGGPLNTIECEFEGGDCIIFNIAYPLCRGKNLVNVQNNVGNGKCDEEFMLDKCDYDGGDCCPYEIINSKMFGDGQCNVGLIGTKFGLIGTKYCGFDRGDCSAFHRAYPECPLQALSGDKNITDTILGDGICDSGSFSSVECGYEYGDCDVGEIGQDVTLLTDSPIYSYINTELSLDGGTVIVGSPYTDSNGTYDSLSAPGLVKSYRYNNKMQKWLPLESLIGTENGDAFGSGIAISQNGNRIAVSSRSGYIMTFDLNPSNSSLWHQVGQTIQLYEDDNAPSPRIGLSADGRRLAIAGPFSQNERISVGRIQMYDMDSSSSSGLMWTQVGGDIIGKTEFENIGYPILQLSPDGSRIVFSARENGTPAIVVHGYSSSSPKKWDQIGGSILTPNLNALSSISLSSDGKRIAIAHNPIDSNSNYPQEVQVHELNLDTNAWDPIGEPIRSDKFSSIRSVSMSSDGNVLAISSGCNSTFNLHSCAGTGNVELFIYDLFIPVSSRRYVQVPSLGTSPDVDDHALQERKRDRENNIFGWHLSMNGDASILSISGYSMRQETVFLKVYNLNEIFYTRCIVNDPDEIGDGVCDDDTDKYKYLRHTLNTTECGFEGGDCLL